MNKIVSMTITEFLDYIKEQDPAVRVEIVCSWIQQRYVSQIEDSVNLIKEGVTEQWIFQGFNTENGKVIDKIIKQFNEHDADVYITKVEIDSSEIEDEIANDAELIKIINTDDYFMDRVREKTLVRATYVFKEDVTDDEEG